MEERLKYALDLASGWLRFAEKKNGGIVVAATGLVLGIAQFSPGLRASGSEFVFCSSGMTLLFAAGVVSLFSFVPNVAFVWSFSQRAPCNEENLFFFGHVAYYAASDYVTALYDAMRQPSVGSKVELDLAGQVITNSQIALRKFKCAAVATWLLLIGAACSAIAAMIHIF